MIARKMKDGTYAVGDVCDGKFTPLATAANAGEAKALVKTLEAIMNLFQARPGAWKTVGNPGGNVSAAPPGKLTKSNPAKRKPKKPRS
jgi:hypothetical protein